MTDEREQKIKELEQRAQDLLDRMNAAGWGEKPAPPPPEEIPDPEEELDRVKQSIREFSKRIK